MSSNSYYQPSDHHHQVAPARSHPAAAVSRHVQRHTGDYTLVHAGRQVRIGPVAFWIVVGTVVVMGVWSLATGTYFAFKDSVLTRLIGRQTEMQFAYEDRVAELRAQIDRITSRQLLDQEQFEQKLEALLRRQAMLESRTSALTGDMIATGSARAPRNSAPTVPRNSDKPSPINDTIIFVAPPDREARLESRGGSDVTSRMAAKAGNGGLDGTLGRMALALDRIEKRQGNALGALEETVEAKARRMRGVLADLGVDAGKTQNDVTGSIGGPFVAAKPPGGGASAFERQLYRIHVSRAQVDRYSQVLNAVPLRKPIFGEVDMSSPFGMRMDPFMRGPAIHTGIDIRGDTGDPVRVTANGTVTIASPQGGYGNMIEVDHHNGFATRYGHLSKIEVKVGQKVRIGDTIGRIGSTGRSTGPHLHYETRVQESPVDPQKFLRAGVRLGGL